LQWTINYPLFPTTLLIRWSERLEERHLRKGRKRKNKEQKLERETILGLFCQKK